MWRVDRFGSHLIGQSMRGAAPPVDVHPIGHSRALQVWSEIVFVAICHQANWDRLYSRVLAIVARDPEWLSPAHLAELQSGVFREAFGAAFDDERLRVSERMGILRDLGRNALDWPNGVTWLNGPVTLSGDSGLYRWLERFRCYSEDPLQKKSSVLIHQLLRYSLINVTDHESIGPAIDYHLMRLYVRTGRVLPMQSDLITRLQEWRTARVEFLNGLRESVKEAMYYTALGAGLRIDQLNTLEWQIARSFCVRERARCNEGALIDKPASETVIMLSQLAGGGCPLSINCRGARDELLRSIKDPKSAKSYY